MSEDPTIKLLRENLGKTVLIKLKWNRIVKGKLVNFDQKMNLVLEEAVETFDNGQTSDLGYILIRGDTIIIMSPFV